MYIFAKNKQVFTTGLVRLDKQHTDWKERFSFHLIKLNDPTGESTGPLGTDSKTRIRQNQNIVIITVFFFTTLRIVFKGVTGYYLGDWRIISSIKPKCDKWLSLDLRIWISNS